MWYASDETLVESGRDKISRMMCELSAMQLRLALIWAARLS